MVKTRNKIGIEFGVRLKKLREDIGFTQTLLAEKVGVSATSIQNYESGTLPKGGYLVKLSRSLDCTIDWLLTGEGEMFTRKEDTNPTIYQTSEAGTNNPNINGNGNTYVQNNGANSVVKRCAEP